MIFCSCQGLHGCVPVPQSAIPSPSARGRSWARRSASLVWASSNVSQRPVLTSTSEAMSSPMMWPSSSVPCAVGKSSSKRLTSPSEDGSRSANSSSTASVKSLPFSNCSRASVICSSGLRRCSSPIRAKVSKRKYRGGDPLPTPAGDRGPACPLPKPPVRVGRKREDRLEPGGELGGVARAEAREVTQLRRVLGLEAGGDLGEAGVPCDERWGAAGRCLGGDHPEGLGKDRGRDGDVGEGEEVDEVPVLERAGEEHPPPGGPRLELAAGLAEADDDGPRLEALER